MTTLKYANSTGQVNILIDNMNDAPSLLQNVAPSSNPLVMVQLVGTQSYRSAIGARVRVQVGSHRMIDEARSGGSFCSQSELRLHFGPGSNREANLVEVMWLSGRKEVVKNVAGDQWLVIMEGAGLVRAQKLLAPPKL